ncbi:MAG: lytic transglycosylase domain-containing protein [Deltaproteobacteria bacterium]|jgi:soluble lytic murein transglycosylase|nr:lytic transglycosylase domain-containing protein [Deltaproteobacteria bacterium]
MIRKILNISIIFLFLSVVLVPLALAGIYRYVDASGKVHFTNVPTDNKYRFYRGEGEQYRLETLINHFAQKFQLDQALIKAVIKVESDFNPRVVSTKGAQGLMQLMPDTAREIGVKNPFDPSDSIYGGSFYLRQMLDSFELNLDHALAAYNAGPNAVRKYGGIPPYEETQNYVKRVKHYIDFYRRSKDTF